MGASRESAICALLRGPCHVLEGFFLGCLVPIGFLRERAAISIDFALRVTNADFLTIRSPLPGTMPAPGRTPTERRGEIRNHIFRDGLLLVGFHVE